MTAPRPRGSNRHRPGQGRGPSSSRPGQRRCAVYTRKSSEEGLEQEYNSLHAQREACEAYIRSQQHEGWVLVPTPFDDGGISGGTMVRPALQALLAEIRAGRVDVIVVYKVDRLTRSLADFAKMVELFDATGASFVAVTQQFNTTTSMGRLTLNVLLSFAQFEREVTGERIRDKIAASKRKGMWMGGNVPLGYTVQDRKLVVVPEDAARVVHIYQRYLDLGSVRELKAELDREGIISRPRRTAGGTEVGGTSFSRGALYALLSNSVYIGQVRHKDECHPGQHAAIVPDALFAAAQAKLASSNNGQKGRPRTKVEPSLLAGKLFDEAGERLVPSHARKGERRYRYYVSASLLAAAPPAELKDSKALCEPARTTAGPPRTRQDRSDDTGWRLPADEIERAVAAALDDLMQRRPTLVAGLLENGAAAAEIPSLMDRLFRAERQDGKGPSQNGPSLHWPGSLVHRVELSSSVIVLTLAVPSDPGALPDQTPGLPNFFIRHAVPHCLRRRGVEMRMVLEVPAAPAREDYTLLKIVARAHGWFEEMTSGHAKSACAIAERLGVEPSYVRRLLPLAMMAPDLVEQIAEGRQPADLTAEWLQRNSQLPHAWAEQAAALV